MPLEDIFLVLDVLVFNLKSYMINPVTNYALADFVSSVNFGIIRNVRFMKVHKTTIAIRLVHILYMQGVLRAYKIENDYIEIYYKFHHSRHIITELKIISKPSNRCYRNLKRLAKHTNTYNFSGFYIISTQKGIFTSDYCLLQAHVCGEILIKVSL